MNASLRAPGRLNTLIPLLLGVVGHLLSITNLPAPSGTWDQTKSGNWSASGNWLDGVVADGAGFTATFPSINGLGTRTVTLDTSRTIGSIAFTPNNKAYVLSGTSTLTLDNTGGTTPPLVRGLNAPAVPIYVVLAGSQGFRGPDQVGGIRLNAANTFVGNVEIARGPLVVGHANALPSGSRTGNIVFTNYHTGIGTLDLNGFSITINGLEGSSTGNVGVVTNGSATSVTLTLGDNNASGAFFGVIGRVSPAGNISLTKIGSGTQTLSGINTYGGATTVSGGMLLGVTGGSCANSAVSVGGSGTFGVRYAGGGTKWTVASLTYSASGAKQYFDFGPNMPSATTAPLEVSGALAFTATPTVDVASASPIPTGTYPLFKYGSMSGTMPTSANLLAGGTATLSNHPASLTIYMNVVGYVGPTRHWATGDGDWDFTTANWKLSDGSGAVFTNGAPVEFLDLDATGNPVVTVVATVQPASVVVDSAKHYTLTGTGTIGGSGSVNKLGSGTLTLALANAYTGGTTISAGRLNINNPSALGSTSGTLNIAGGAIGNTSGSALTLDDYPQVWSGDFTFAGSDDLNLGAGAVTLTAARTVTVDASVLTVGGNISGSGFGLTKAGAGTLVLNGALGTGSGTLTINAGTARLNAANTFSGATRVVSGTLVLGHSSALQNSTFNLAAGDTGVLEFASGVTAATLGGLTGGDATRTIVLTNAASLPVALTAGNNNASTTFIGKLIGGSFTKIGTGTLQSGATAAGDATAFQLEGDFTINDGRVTLHATGGGGLNAVQGLIVVNSPGVLDLAHRPSLGPIRGLSGNGTVDKSIVGAGANATITVGRDDASATFSGLIKETPGTTVVALTKTGSGTQTLSGANTYSGTTTINGGVLKVSNTSGSATGSGAVIVNAGGTLMGSGSVSGAVTINGIVAPGESVGTLTTGAETWNGGGKYVWEINDADTAGGWDKLNAGANSINVAADSGNKFTLELKTLSGSSPGPAADFDPDQNYTWRIAAAGSVQNFAATDFTINDTNFVNDLKGGTFAVEADSGGINLKFVRNQAPAATARSVVRGRGATLKIKVADLLAENTSDPDGDDRELVNVGVDTAPSHGSVSVSGGYILYVPNDLNSTDSDSFSFKVKDVRSYRTGDTVRTAVGSVNVSVAGAATGTVTIQHTGGGQVTLRFYGIPGYQYVIQRSCGDLNSWADLYGPVTAPNTGTNIGLIEYTDTPGDGCDPAFYRVRQY